MVNLTLLLPLTGLTLPSLQRAHRTAGPAAAGLADPGWQQAYRRASARVEDETPEHATDELTAPPDPMPAWPLPARPLPTPEAPARLEPAGRVEPASATAVRMAEAVRQVAAPPLAVTEARLWQIELPGAAPGWQLQITQTQPLAPLALELRVPTVMAPQAQQQLADLDRRLRDNGHELLRSRLRPGTRPADRRRRGDEVDG